MINIGNSSIENILVGNTLVDRVYLGTDIVWERQQPSVKNYLKFTALESGTFTLTIPASVTADSLASISYSLDDGATWVTTQNTSSAVTITTPTVEQGGTVLWKGSGTRMATSNSSGSYSNFTSTGNYGVTGNIMSLLYEDTFNTQKEIEADYALCNLFRDCNTIITANDLEFPAMRLRESCYRELFGNCHYLVEARFDLPAPVASPNTYRSMFGNDERLVTADVTIYAHTLSDYCCRYMCGGCASLTTAPIILATTLTGPGGLQDTFTGCKKLQYIKALFTTTPSGTVSKTFTSGVASTGTFVKNGAATWTTTGTNAVPTGWTVVTEEPQDYFTFRFVESGIFYWYTSDESSFTRTIEYKKNADAWTSVTSSADGTVCAVENGDVIQLRGIKQTYATLSYYCSFGTSGRAYISGNLDSMINYQHILNPYYFKYMLRDCTLIDIDPTCDLLLLSESLNNECYYGLFKGCTSLTKTPELPARIMSYSCYLNMFDSCTSLSQVSELPATSLNTNCYKEMFRGCTSMTTTPKMTESATAASCFNGMFKNCTNLISVTSDLLSDSVTGSAYYEMFRGCSKLTTAPRISATSLDQHSCNSMFYDCISLVTIPEFSPIEFTNTYCCRYMFCNCVSLTTAPELPATTLTNNCYSNMFSGCSSLSHITCLAVNIADSTCTSGWVDGVASSGTFIKNSSATFWQSGQNGIPTNWTVETVTRNYLKFTALESGTFTLTIPSAVTSSHLTSISYSLDNGATWVTTLNDSSVVTITTPTVALGGTVLWKGSGNRTAIGNRNGQYSTFSSTSNFMCSGNIMSLLYGDDFEDKVVLEQGNTFLRLFYQCTTITTPPKLPATTLTSNCYGDMFNGCTSLTTAPELPATTLSSYCYSAMFNGCTLLTTVPTILPATTLYESCYNYMFSGCSSLTIAPELPATILVSSCYRFMFNNCRALTRITCLATDISAGLCVDRWVQNVNSNAGTFVKNENMSSWTTGSSGIPTNWTVVDYNS